MLESSFAILKGTSGVGKSTRLLQLLMFFIDSKENGGLNLDYQYIFKDIKYIDNYKELEVKNSYCGIYIKKFNIFFMSKWSRSQKSKLIGIQGIDVINIDGKYEPFVSLCKSMKNVNFIAEGYNHISSSKIKCNINEIFNNFNKNIFMQYYFYDFLNGKDHMLERIITRSGSNNLCSGNSSWAKNNMLLNGYNYNVEIINDKEFIKKSKKYSIILEKLDYNDNINIFGIKYLKFIGLEDLIEEFKKYSINNNAERDYRYLEENHTKYLKYFNETKKIIRENMIKRGKNESCN